MTLEEVTTYINSIGATSETEFATTYVRLDGSRFSVEVDDIDRAFTTGNYSIVELPAW